MRIAIFSDGYFPTLDGVVTQINNLHHEFVRMGHEVLIVAPSHSDGFEERFSKGTRIILLRSISLPTYKTYRIAPPHSDRVFAALKDFRPDIIHVQTPFGVGWLGLRYARTLKVPVLGTFHTMFSEFMAYLPLGFLRKAEFMKELTWKYTALFYNMCDLVSAPTPRLVSELRAHGIKNVSTISNGIDFELFNKCKKKKYDQKKIKLIYFGRISYEKNIDVLIRGYKLLRAKHKNISLTITGDGPALDYLKQVAAFEGVLKTVKFHPSLNAEKLARHVAAHDILLTASTIETQGLTILESMAAGVCCVGADFLGIPDSIVDKKTGFLFRPFDAKDLAAKTSLLIKSSVLRKKMGQAGIEVARNYSKKKIALETINVYLKIIGKK